ncbi:MAG TPA: 50S ribosomal protein L11 methyltransferase [Fimbriimonadaceae bacterium]|nr:50S ribosomal protein L11 methyltransferase [Fimbriimonadaceae bacterium]
MVAEEMSLAWIEVKAVFDEPPADWSVFIDVFASHGCENTLQEDDPPSLSSAVVAVDGSEDVVRALSNDLVIMGACRVDTRSLEDENWDEHWKQFFHPREVGERFVIRPTWEEAPPSDRLEIILDPGQAFGTGDHPTTRMCLDLLERAISQRDVAGAPERVADVGCGSGILSIAACLLGARSVWAVDIEPLSVEVAKENAAMNHVVLTGLVGQGIEPVRDQAPFDLVVSNIISAVLIRLAPEVAPAIAPGGIWIVSGIIRDNWPDVLVAVAEAGFALREKLEEDGWVGATLVRSAEP